MNGWRTLEGLLGSGDQWDGVVAPRWFDTWDAVSRPWGCDALAQVKDVMEAVRGVGSQWLVVYLVQATRAAFSLQGPGPTHLLSSILGNLVGKVPHHGAEGWGPRVLVSLLQD